MVIRSLLPRFVPVVLIAAAAIASGCGSSSSDSGSSSSSGSGTAAGGGSSSDAARVKFTRCLRDNGIDIPDGGGGNRQALQDIDQAKLQAAMKACQKYQQDAVGDVSDSQRQEFQDAFTKFSACMRQHGVDVPDNVGSGAGGPPAGGAQIDQDDPKVKAATSACQDKLPQGGFPGGGGQ